MNSIKTVLITGTSSGIGKALAGLISQLNYNLIATSRRASLNLVREYLGTDTERKIVVPLDVTNKEECQAAIDIANKIFGGVDILINNAGISYRAMQEDMTDEDEHLQMATNFFGPLTLTRLVLPHMREKRWGRIINVSSVGGMMAMPTMGSYSASKFALEGATEALWYEGHPYGIKVSLVQPGFVRSNGFERVRYSKRFQDRDITRCIYAQAYKDMGQFIAKNMNRAFATPESIAKKIITVMESTDPPLRVPVTFDAHLFSALRRFLPRRLYHYLLYRSLPSTLRRGCDG